MRTPKTPEKNIENAILQYLSMRKDVFVWKNQTLGVFDPVKKIFRKSNNPYHLNGVADILGIFKGRPLAIEVKSRTGRISENQMIFLKRFASHGGLAIVARSVEEVITALEAS